MTFWEAGTSFFHVKGCLKLYSLNVQSMGYIIFFFWGWGGRVVVFLKSRHHPLLELVLASIRLRLRVLCEVELIARSTLRGKSAAGRRDWAGRKPHARSSCTSPHIRPRARTQRTSPARTGDEEDHAAGPSPSDSDSDSESAQLVFSPASPLRILPTTNAGWSDVQREHTHGCEETEGCCQFANLQIGDCRPPWGRFTSTGRSIPAAEKPPTHSMPLSLEQRRVFVTYEADDDAHVNEIIKFVALLRHNGFDTHIDIFEQQFRSISKIDFMERYLSEVKSRSCPLEGGGERKLTRWRASPQKEYLIIIIISPKYHETVTASHVGADNDERTCNTVYIHKQLQNEFIQNGSKNFRFIPILFPGAKKSHVPNWLLNTHVYSWPRDRDDILRRLMRVEKYNPPPVGELPTIVSIPI
ncbi:uncharacterized protein traf3ip2l isoform X4 [Phyllopteryx taeniolatus]|uniref:uncharacterized protein traf3ip2l isoform X4 n=1 Tax=Phyllopteryx taeniolatus TaxID=161469 RepID=UPI002AD3560B|nr:uncharacterized protein traf3ip2l isoform X4 [Phyllopteryx taeniolatus]